MIGKILNFLNFFGFILFLEATFGNVVFAVEWSVSVHQFCSPADLEANIFDRGIPMTCGLVLKRSISDYCANSDELVEYAVFRDGILNLFLNRFRRVQCEHGCVNQACVRTEGEVDQEACHVSEAKSSGGKISIVNSSGISADVPYEIKGSVRVVAGDMIVPSIDPYTKAFTTEFHIQRWPDGLIRYYFDSTVTESDKSDFRIAAKIWREDSGSRIRLEEITSTRFDGNFVTVKTGTEPGVCRAFLGYIPIISKFVTLAPNSICSVESLVHEIGHLVGMLHEHQRPDRDQYVKINWCNVDPNYFSAIEKINIPFLFETRGTYDYQSIMHYFPTAFNDNDGITIQTLGAPIGRGTRLSELDKQAIMEMY